jgi:hypothetical protein
MAGPATAVGPAHFDAQDFRQLSRLRANHGKYDCQTRKACHGTAKTSCFFLHRNMLLEKVFFCIFFFL